MEKEKKLRKIDMLGILEGLVGETEVENKAELLEFLAKEKNAIVKKASKPTKAQLINQPIKEAILEVLKDAGQPMLIKDVTANEKLQGFEVEVTSHKVSALLTQLKEAGLVVRTEDHKKIYYSIAD